MLRFTSVPAKILCTTTRARKAVVSLALVAVTIGVGGYLDHYVYAVHLVVCHVTLPVTVLIINMVVVCEVRRASNNAAANLGRLQRHHVQSTSSNSAVPTVMLVATSLVYVLFRGAASVFTLGVMNRRTSGVWHHCRPIADALSKLVFAYNFYVYSITGKQFRSELRALFCRSSSSSVAVAVTVVADNCNDARSVEQTDSAV